MLRSANEDYGYEADDILTDVISSFCVIACGLGEILGPLYSGFVTDLLGMEPSCNIAALLSFAFAIAFALGTGTFTRSLRKKHGKKDSLINTKVMPEESLSS